MFTRVLCRLGPGPIPTHMPSLKRNFFLIGVMLIYNVVLVSAVQKNESVIPSYISTFFFQILFPYRSLQGFSGGASGQESACQCRRCQETQVGKISWKRKWQPAPVSCLENSMDRGAWWAIAHGVVKRLIGLSDNTHRSSQGTE